MNTPIVLSSNTSFTLQLSGLGTPGALILFAWLHVVGQTGAAVVLVRDRRTGDSAGDEVSYPVLIPGSLTVPVRKSLHPIPSEVVITAGSIGFKGEVCIEMVRLGT